MIRIFIAGCLIFISGCAGSRWARSDADYAFKYDEHSDNVLQIAKQSVDARFLGGRDGYYFGLGGGDSPATGSVNVGRLVMPTSWLETRIGLTGLAGGNGESLYGGGVAAARIQTPTRLAPFIGAGVFAGVEPWEVLLADDDEEFGEDDDRDHKNDFSFAAYPEAGLHWWVTPQFRMTTSAAYYSGWQGDPWMFSVSFATVPGRETVSESDWKNVLNDW